MRLTDIQIRDPFVLPIAATQTYYLFGTTDKNCWTGPGVGFDGPRNRKVRCSTERNFYGSVTGRRYDGLAPYFMSHLSFFRLFSAIWWV